MSQEIQKSALEKRTIHYTEELTEINADNIQEKIFNRFSVLCLY
ncbi:hypothetical protein N4T77_14820 [Clostridium sp. CX1]|nr:hypothetical protein [Clostridium sp. CX1]MCT8977870.1 hypothetical protein [Clostridium sp. CX1]